MRAFALLWAFGVTAWLTFLAASGRYVLAALFAPFVVLAAGIAAYWNGKP